MQLDLISPRPLAEVALELEKRFGRVITYEDAPYYHPDDIIEDEGGRIVPRGGQIFVQYQDDDDLAEVIDRAVEIHARSGYPGVFAVEEHAGDYHIVPRGFRNTDGAVEERFPLLHTTISLPAKTRTGLQLVEDIAIALSEARRETVAPGTLPTNAFVQHYSKDATLKGKARDLLVELFREMGLPLSWQLFSDPGNAAFYLNIHQLPERVI